MLSVYYFVFSVSASFVKYVLSKTTLERVATFPCWCENAGHRTFSIVAPNSLLLRQLELLPCIAPLRTSHARASSSQVTPVLSPRALDSSRRISAASCAAMACNRTY